MQRSHPFQRSGLFARATGARIPSAVIVLLCCASAFSTAQQHGENNSRFPYPEKLSYRIEWRLVPAGSATVEMTHGTPDDWETKLNLQSAGLVTRLFRIIDTYTVTSDDKFCADSSVLDAQEGKRHMLTRLTFERSRSKVDYDQRDLTKNVTVKKQLDAPACTYEIAGALQALRAGNLQPGRSSSVPITDGKKIANVRIEAQAKEALNLNGRTYQTIRYEAFVFDNVLYKHRGRMLIWISDDADRIPVQIRLQLGFPLGNVVVQLDKQQRT